MTTKRAKKGGEIGANGEFYEGGKFINTIPENGKKEGSIKRKPRKVQIEPYVWVTVEEFKRTLFSLVGTYAEYIDRRDWTKGIKPFLPFLNSPGAYGKEFTVEEVQQMCDRFNAGERFM